MGKDEKEKWSVSSDSLYMYIYCIDRKISLEIDKVSYMKSLERKIYIKRIIQMTI